MPQHDVINAGRQRFVVLDRDGTIIEERHYLSDPGEVALAPGAARGLRQLAGMGLGLVIITNQSGIGRGYFDLNRLSLVHERLGQLLGAEGVRLDGIYFCPHMPADDCDCRKPRPGLLELASRALNFEPGDCFVIGDKACDIELGQQAGAVTFLVSTGYGSQVALESAVNPDHTVRDILEAADIIQGLLNPAQSSVQLEAGH